MRQFVFIVFLAAVGFASVGQAANGNELRPIPMFSGSEELFEQGIYKISCLTGRYKGGGYPEFRMRIVRVPKGETWVIRCDRGSVTTRKL